MVLPKSVRSRTTVRTLVWMNMMIFACARSSSTVRTIAFATTRRASRSNNKSNNFLLFQSSSSSSSFNSNVVSSLKSNTVKKWQGLLKKRKKRIEENATIVEGPRMVFDLLDNVQTRKLVEHVLVCEDSPGFFDEAWIDRLHEYETRYSNEEANRDDSHLVISQGTQQVLLACTDTVTPQGIVATVKIPPPPSTTQAPLQTQPSSSSSSPLYLVLDGVSDPGNVGTLLRSSVATGVSAVILLPQCCDVWNPKAVRSAMGCSFQVPILCVDSLKECMDVLRNGWGVQDIWAATMVEKDGPATTASASVEHYNVDWTSRPTALMIGSEGTGLSKDARLAVSKLEIRAVHVPMEAGIESLNAAVCGSVIMFEFLRQCQTAASSGGRSSSSSSSTD